MIAILDNIRSVHNVGSIFRTSDGAGVEKLYLCGFTPTPLNKIGDPRKKMEKVSLGAEKTIPWEKVERTEQCIKNLKEEGYSIYAIEEGPQSAIPYHQAQISNDDLKKTAFVFGHEVNGLSDEIIELSNQVLEIPMHGTKESLNISIAFGIIAYHFTHLNS